MKANIVEIKKKYFKGKKVSDEKVLEFVNSVWDKFLKEGYYIAMPLSSLITNDIEEILNSKSYGFKIIGNEIIKVLPLGEVGLIVNIDWKNSDEVYMPDELYKVKYISTIPNIVGVYSINNGEGKVSSHYQNALKLSDILNVPFLSFNKHDYDPTYEMEYDTLVSDVICLYLMNKTYDININDRDRLIEKYQDDIIKTYKMLNKEDKYDDEIFISRVFNFISTKENIKGYKL